MIIKKAQAIFQEKKGALWILGLILSLAFILRVCHSEKSPHERLGFSEGLTIAEASSPFCEIPSSITVDQGPLKYYILHAVLYFGRSDFLLSLPAFFFDLASILLLFYLGVILFDRRAALLACFFMAVSVWHIHYATSARDYPLYIFFIIASTVFLYRATKHLNNRDWIFYVSASTLAFYSFYPFMFFMAAQALWFFLFFGKQRDLVRRFLISSAGMIVMAVPALQRLVSAFEFKQNGIESWGLRGYEILRSLMDHFGGVAGLFPWGILVFMASFIWVLYFQKKRPQALLLAISVVVPISFFVLCVYVFRMSLAPRYFLLTYPFFLLLAASGIVSWPHRILRLAGVVVFLLPLGMFGFYQMDLKNRPFIRRYIPADYFISTNLDFPEMASLIRKNADSLDFVVVEPATAIYAMQYYLDEANESPVVMMRSGSGQSPYYVYRNSKSTLLGIDGDFSKLDRLSSAGRLLVVDIGGEIKNFKNGDKIVSWLRAKAYRIDHGMNVDFYFISPPQKHAKDFKASSTEALQELFHDSCLVKCLIYPFNRKGLVFNEDPKKMLTSCQQRLGIQACQ